METRIGSMADVPANLVQQIKELERLFTVDQSKLKKITNHFVDELTKGDHSRVALGIVTRLT